MDRSLPGTTVQEKLQLNHVLDGECWRWTGAHNPKGYGQLVVANKRKAVHRLAYELWVGTIGDGLEIDHTCNVRDCVNPAHLEAVSHAENVRRTADRRTRCPHGHDLVPANIKWRMTRGRKYPACRRCFNDRRNRRRAVLREVKVNG